MSVCGYKYMGYECKGLWVQRGYECRVVMSLWVMSAKGYECKGLWVYGLWGKFNVEVMRQRVIVVAGQSYEVTSGKWHWVLFKVTGTTILFKVAGTTLLFKVAGTTAVWKH